MCRLHSTQAGVELHSWRCGMLIRVEIVTSRKQHIYQVVTAEITNKPMHKIALCMT